MLSGQAEGGVIALVCILYCYKVGIEKSVPDSRGGTRWKGALRQRKPIGRPFLILLVDFPPVPCFLDCHSTYIEPSFSKLPPCVVDTILLICITHNKIWPLEAKVPMSSSVSLKECFRATVRYLQQLGTFIYLDNLDVRKFNLGLLGAVSRLWFLACTGS